MNCLNCGKMKMQINIKEIEKLEKQLEQIKDSKDIPFKQRKINCGRKIKILGKIRWIYANFPQFNYGWVNGYPGGSMLDNIDSFQHPSNETIELTKQQELDYEHFAHMEVVDLYKNDPEGWSEYLRFKEKYKNI